IRNKKSSRNIIKWLWSPYYQSRQLSSRCYTGRPHGISPSKDQPGAIGRVGTTLAKDNINIATMQVGRSEVGGEAIMMMTVDKQVEQTGLELLKELEDIYKVTAVTL